MMQLWFTAKEVHQVSATNICHLVLSFVQKTASGPHRFQFSTECRANNEKPKMAALSTLNEPANPLNTGSIDPGVAKMLVISYKVTPTSKEKI